MTQQALLPQRWERGHLRFEATGRSLSGMTIEGVETDMRTDRATAKTYRLETLRKRWVEVKG